MAKKQHFYTKEEEKYILKYYPTCNTKAMAKQLKVTPASVGSKAWELGVTKAVERSQKKPPTFPIVTKPPKGKWEEGKVYSVGTITIDQADCYEPQLMAEPPRKNWLQRLVSWLLEGKV